jgi:hypothetical protein
MAPIWLPVWRTEKISGLCSGRASRASSVELAGVSGPKARPTMRPATSSAASVPRLATAMATAIATAHSAATVNEPSRAASIPP